MSTTTVKRPWAQAMEDAESFRALFPAACIERWEFAGSLRRRKSEVADIEHVVIPAFGDVPRGDGLFTVQERVNLLWHHLDAMVKAGTVSKHVYGGAGYRWGDKYRGVDYRGFNNEIFCADADNWGNTFLIRTGPAEFSQRVVTRLKDGGMYRQVEGYLIHVHTADRVPVPDEETYFRLAGMQYVPPERRA